MSTDGAPLGLGRKVVVRLAADIGAAASWLSELDGATGDGDHGINMRTGMDLALTRVEADASLSDGLQTVSETLLNEVGGAMGPLYGVFFAAMAEACSGHAEIDADCVLAMLTAGTDAVVNLGGAVVGDKTLVDVLVPTTSAFGEAVRSGRGLGQALAVAAETAARSRDSTSEMQAKVGRAARAGERSRGQIDAGAASCALIISCICSVLATTAATSTGSN